jgi:Flp pilus assembly protein TadG
MSFFCRSRTICHHKKNTMPCTQGLGAPGSCQERGQSLVEVAVSFVILVILLEGAVDLGRALFAYISIRDAAQEGAVYGSIQPTDTNGIIQRVRSSSNAPVDMGDASRVNVAVSIFGASCSGGTIQVTVTYNFQFITPIVPLVLPQGITLSTMMTSTILSPPCP